MKRQEDKNLEFSIELEIVMENLALRKISPEEAKSKISELIATIKK